MFHACFLHDILGRSIQLRAARDFDGRRQGSAGMCSARNNPSNASRILTAAMDGEKTDEEDDI